MIATELSQLGVDVRLMVVENPNARTPGDVGERVRFSVLLPSRRSPSRVEGAIRICQAMRALDRELRRDPPDVVYSALTTTNLMAWAVTRRMPGVKLAWGFRATKEPFPYAPGLVLRTLARCSRDVDLAIANADAVLGWALSTGVRAKRACVIPNGLDTDRFCPAPSSPSSARTGRTAPDTNGRPAWRIGCLARFTPEKDHGTLLRAIALLRGDGVDAECWLAGGGAASIRNGLVRLVDELGLQGKVHFVGEVKAPEDFLRTLDVHVLTSTHEGSPNVVLEAMACGIPTVSTRVGGVPEIVGDAGVLVPAGTPERFASALATLLRNDEERDRLRNAGRARVVAEFSKRKTAEVTLARLSELLTCD
jgi:glycosyltransferase involved in cell wall biosynthesis